MLVRPRSATTLRLIKRLLGTAAPLSEPPTGNHSHAKKWLSLRSVAAPLSAAPSRTGW
jgi:hypothetical protein